MDPTPGEILPLVLVWTAIFTSPLIPGVRCVSRAPWWVTVFAGVLLLAAARVIGKDMSSERSATETGLPRWLGICLLASMAAELAFIWAWAYPRLQALPRWGWSDRLVENLPLPATVGLIVVSVWLSYKLDGILSRR